MIKPSITSIDLSHKSERNRSAIWADGTKHALVFNIEGVTDQGLTFYADVTVILQTWTDQKDGQFVLTTDLSIERFTNVTGHVPTPEGRGAGWKYSDLTEEQIDAEEAAQEKADWAAEVFCNEIGYKADLYFIRDQIKEAAFKAHFNLR